MPTLEEVKLYLRIDSDDEDSLITSLMETAKEMVEGILRKNLTEFSPIPETIKQAIMYAISRRCASLWSHLWGRRSFMI